MTGRADKPRRWRWVVLMLVALIVVPVLTLGSGRGECFDAAAGSGVESYCTSGPAIGWAGTWVVLGICAIVVIYALVRLLTSGSGENGHQRTDHAQQDRSRRPRWSDSGPPS